MQTGLQIWTHWDMLLSFVERLSLDMLLCREIVLTMVLATNRYCAYESACAVAMALLQDSLKPLRGQFYRHLRGQFYRHALRFRGQFIPTYVNAFVPPI